MKRVGFISNNLKNEKQILSILQEFEKELEIKIETLDRLNPRLPTIIKLETLFELCDIIIFHISELSRNIYFEIGLSLGLKKEILIIANTQELIPINLSFLRSIVVKNINEDFLKFELRSLLDSKVNSIQFIKNNSKFFYDNYFNNYSPKLTFRDLYAFNGLKREENFRLWFYELAKNVNQWKLIESNKNEKNSMFDFVIWNSSEDPELLLLGNPIPIEFKGLNSMNIDSLKNLSEKIKKQGLKSIILLSTSKNRKNTEKLAKKLKQEHNIIFLALDRDDLIDIQSPPELYFSIKEKILKIMYGGN